MSKDARGWRCKFAVVAPSTNTIVQPDMDDLRVPGVTNHFGRIHVPNMRVTNDKEFVDLVEAIGATLYDAVDRCTTAQPDYLVMGMSALMFWDGRDASEKRMHALGKHCGLNVSAGSFACEAALNLFKAKKIAVISPYFPISDKNVALIIKKYASLAGLDSSKYAGHSLRSGFATSTAESGAEERNIMAMTGHKSTEMVRRYIKEANLFKNNALNKIKI